MAFDEDLTAFFSTDDFAVTATWTPDGDTSSTITGIFDNEYIEGIGGGEVDFEASQPMFLVKTADVPNVAQGDQLYFNNTYYRIVNVQPDGTGLTVLILEELDLNED